MALQKLMTGFTILTTIQNLLTGFAWVNSYFAEAILYLAETKPWSIFKDSTNPTHQV
jgi:hypothetical protein